MSVVDVEVKRWDSLQAKTQEARVLLAFESFRAAGIEPVLIKGWAAARNYPSGHLRRPGDVDLAVSPADFPVALKLLDDPEAGRLLIDLHNGLCRLDSLSWDDIYDHSITVE